MTHPTNMTVSFSTFERLKGKGVKSSKGSEMGDMYLDLKIVPPEKLEEESKKILEEFARLNPQGDLRKHWR